MNDRARLLVCINLISLRCCRVLSALCLKVGQGGGPCNTGCSKSSFDAAARRWNNWSFGWWRRSSLRFHCGCGRCRAQTVDATWVRDVECLWLRRLARRCSCACVLARRRPVLLVVFGERIRLSAALSLRRFGKQPLVLIWGLWARRIWQWLGRGASTLCKPRRLDRPVLVSPSISAYAGSVGIMRIEACALPRRERSRRCCIRAPPAPLRLWRSRIPCWAFALTERGVSTLAEIRGPVVLRVWERRRRWWD